MNDKSANPSIGCTVSACAHHCKGQSYCTLSAIQVGCCTPTATDCGGTECASFARGDSQR